MADIPGETVFGLAAGNREPQAMMASVLPRCSADTARNAESSHSTRSTKWRQTFRVISEISRDSRRQVSVSFAGYEVVTTALEVGTFHYWRATGETITVHLLF